jgi:hypothetical protein
MFALRPLLVLGLAAGLMALTPSDADAAKKAKKKKEHAVHGVVESVSKDSVTIKVHAHKKKKKGASAEAKKGETKDVTFTIGKGTTIERVTGKKGSKEVKTADRDDLKKGEHVVVVAKDKEATKIAIVKHKKKKRAKKNADA